MESRLGGDVGGGGKRGFAARGGGAVGAVSRFSVSIWAASVSRSSVRPDTNDLTFRRKVAVNSASSV